MGLQPSSDQLEVLSRIEAVAAGAARRDDEIDDARILPRDLQAEILASGVFHAFAPREYGGLVDHGRGCQGSRIRSVY